MSKIAGGLLLVGLCVPMSAHAVDSICEGCINFHLCSVVRGYTLVADMNQDYIDDAALDHVVADCKYVDGAGSGALADKDMRYFATNSVNFGLSIYYDYAVGGNKDEYFADALVAIKRTALDSCYATGYCDSSSQCHDEYGDKYVLTIGNDNWDIGAPIACTACPGDGTFQGENAPQIGFSSGIASCGISSNTTLSDTTGTYVYSQSCMYELSPDEIMTDGAF